MIVKTTKEINGVVYDYTYSDSDMMIERNGEMYSEAVDPLDSDRTYSETDNPAETANEEAIDIAGACFIYEETDKLIELPKKME